MSPNFGEVRSFEAQGPLIVPLLKLAVVVSYIVGIGAIVVAFERADTEQSDQ